MSGRWAGLLARHGLAPGRRLGQHFLFDGGVLARIAAAAEITPGDHVLEVGPGVGSLTLALLARGAAVLAVEKDGKLVVGTPTVSGAKVTLKVERHGKGRKIIIFKYKAKKNYRRKTSHRQPFTQVTVEKIEA
jgi:hypothetical protein